MFWKRFNCNDSRIWIRNIKRNKNMFTIGKWLRNTLTQYHFLRQINIYFMLYIYVASRATNLYDFIDLNLEHIHMKGCNFSIYWIFKNLVVLKLNLHILFHIQIHLRVGWRKRCPSEFFEYFKSYIHIQIFHTTENK